VTTGRWLRTARSKAGRKDCPTVSERCPHHHRRRRVAVSVPAPSAVDAQTPPPARYRRCRPPPRRTPGSRPRRRGAPTAPLPPGTARRPGAGVEHSIQPAGAVGTGTWSLYCTVSGTSNTRSRHYTAVRRIFDPNYFRYVEHSIQTASGTSNTRSSRRQAVLLPMPISPRERRQQAEDARRRHDDDDEDRHQSRQVRSAVQTPPGGQSSNAVAVQGDQPRVRASHVADAEPISSVRLEPGHPVAAHVLAHVHSPEAGRRKTVSGRRGADVAWSRPRGCCGRVEFQRATVADVTAMRCIYNITTLQFALKK